MCTPPLCAELEVHCFESKDLRIYTTVERIYALTLQRDPGGLAQGFVDLDLGSSSGWWAATVATYCPSRMVGHPKSKSTQPRYPGR